MSDNRTVARPDSSQDTSSWRPVGPLALGAVLRRRPPLPTSVASLLDGRGGAPAFRRVVEVLFPAHAAAILAAERPGATRREARVAAFLERVEADLFPVYELDGWYAADDDPYDFVLQGVPFVRLGWGEEDFHELGRRDGQRLLFALCQQPYDDDGAHLALLESLEPLVPLATLLRIPLGGVETATLHARLDGGRFGAAAEFADWVWGETGTAFLDFDDTVEIHDADWTREIVDALAEQWRRADAILKRIDGLATWLEGDPPARFAALLDAALGSPASETNGEHANDEGVPMLEPEVGETTGDAITCSGGDDGHTPTEPGHADDRGEQPLPARRAA